MKYVSRCIPARVKLSLKFFFSVIDGLILTLKVEPTELPHEGKPRPAGINCAKSSKYNQNDNNQVFQFAPLFHHINRC